MPTFSDKLWTSAPLLLFDELWGGIGLVDASSTNKLSLVSRVGHQRRRRRGWRWTQKDLMNKKWDFIWSRRRWRKLKMNSNVCHTHFLGKQWKGKTQNMKKPTSALESSVLLSLSLQLFTHFKKPNQKNKSFVSLYVPFLIFPPTKHILKNKKKKKKENT